MTKSNKAEIRTKAGRRKALRYQTWIDHGFLRVFWTNLAQIAPGVWRANQPSQRKIAKYKAMGIKTIISLRGSKTSMLGLLEAEACKEHGIDFRCFSFSARNMGSRKNLLSLLDTFETLDGNFLMHCKSGADRAGLASALYLMHMKDVPVAEAKKQLSLRHLHLSFASTGVLDHMLQTYQNDTLQNQMPIREWIETVYDADQIETEFKASRGKS